MPTRTSLLRAQRTRLRLTNAVEFAGSDASFIYAAAKRLAAQGTLEFRAFRALFDAKYHFAQRRNFTLRVKVPDTGRIVVFGQFLGDTAIAHANDIASRQMHERGVFGRANKVNQMLGRFNVGRKRFAQVGIEVGETCAVDD
jgi:hypothetical protein